MAKERTKDAEFWTEVQEELIRLRMTTPERSMVVPAMGYDGLKIYVTDNLAVYSDWTWGGEVGDSEHDPNRLQAFVTDEHTGECFDKDWLFVNTGPRFEDATPAAVTLFMVGVLTTVQNEAFFGDLYRHLSGGVGD